VNIDGICSSSPAHFPRQLISIDYSPQKLGRPRSRVCEPSRLANYVFVEAQRILLSTAAITADAWNDRPSASASRQIAKKRAQADTIELRVSHKFTDRHRPLPALVRHDPIQRQPKACRYHGTSQAVLDA
jgi:hypothetical protein